jgi:GMP synthase (glutamine-hydrolysing)
LRVLTSVHHLNAAAGVFADSAAEAGCELVEWLPHEAPPPPLDGIDAAIIFGGEAQVDDEDGHSWLRPEKQLIRELLERRVPTLGVCLGSQLLAEAAGGGARRSARPEIGWYEIELTAEAGSDPLLGALPERFEGFQYHHYEWLLPPDATVLARSAGCLQAFRLDGRPAWGVQFHPEVTLPDLRSWLDDWESDPGAVASGLDPEAIRAESAGKIGAWNELGRGLSARFFEQAAIAA